MELIKLTEDAEHHVRQWLKWVDDGAKEGEPYSRRDGVCHAAYKTFPPHEGLDGFRALEVFNNICKILEQRVGDYCIFHSMDSYRYRNSQNKFSSTTHDNRYRILFFKLLLQQQGGNYE